ncbi:hypothetical protein PLESTB_000809400 [Pleodorina starrii]|uniref:Bystin n=1 Tax=Pleodorina starrii TaxID=330485 RepID=A0A9W6BLJ7_9CHLO|nr:hypothetical protein PLESTM_000915300 [Pleodorina starrii]GLC53965.1 hypothetical protein PLESTB_000809400 [Pleodorina starrii]GLC70247.1 hypothetical protein PLESTF_000948000 [Pleodorina starrii]
MPKKARVRKPKHSQSLHEQIEDPESYGVRTKPRAEKKRRRADDEEEELLDVKLSGRILKAAREQQQELDAEELFDLDHDDDGDDEDGQQQKRAADPQAALRAALQKIGGGGPGGKGPAADDDSDDDSDGGRGGLHGNDADEQYEEEEVEVDPEDERALAAFLAPGAATYRQTSLADLIVSRLRERQAEQGLAQLAEDGDDPDSAPGPVPDGLEPRVVEVYRGVGKLLSRYTAGKVPKAFKIIPNLRNWEDVLYLTDPDSWSVHAVYQATRLFVSNLNARLAQRFLALVLLPRVRAEIRQHKRLHFALFQALRKATYKPGAFYKGILLPLCQTRTCTLREAVILTSVLKRASLPVLHSAAALLRLAQLEYCGTTSFFMRVLLDKKYALPYRVIDALVDHFVRFADDERQMPVVWHQTLLCFVQRYKHEIRPDDLRALRALCSKQHHYKVSPEVVRELDHGMGRGAGGAAGQAGGAAPMAIQDPGAAGLSKVGANVVENVRDMPPVPMLED